MGGSLVEPYQISDSLLKHYSLVDEDHRQISMVLLLLPEPPIIIYVSNSN
jgi:hypothetical protein